MVSFSLAFFFFFPHFTCYVGQEGKMRGLAGRRGWKKERKRNHPHFSSLVLLGKGVSIQFVSGGSFFFISSSLFLRKEGCGKGKEKK